MIAGTHVVWFKRDLRTVDHRPLMEAAARGRVTPLYVVEPEYWALPDASRRQWSAVRSALLELSARLSALGAPLILRTGTVVDALKALQESVGIAGVFAHEETGNQWTFQRDIAVRRFCREQGVPLFEYRQFGVFRGLRNRDEWGRRHRRFLDEAAVPEPQRLERGAELPSQAAPSADDLGLAEDGCDAPQTGARAEALRSLDSFLHGRGAQYRRAMSSPLTGDTACCRLSTPIATGAISIREVFRRVFDERRELMSIPFAFRAIPVTAIDSLVARLHWHCHFLQKLEDEPALEYRSLHPMHEIARAEIVTDPELLQAWATGRTGFPFLDACMRMLRTTGWLNFRMRAMVQAFASYHLAIDWRDSGMALARLFTDYEPGIHWCQVQMQSGQTGINTPRIYNPVKQGFDQDPEGVFIRRWVPELAHTPAVYLQEPWRMDLDEGRKAGCRIGFDYPRPIVDQKAAALQARDRLTRIRKTPGYWEASSAVFEKHGSRKRQFQGNKPGDGPARSSKGKSAGGRQLVLDL